MKYCSAVIIWKKRFSNYVWKLVKHKNRFRKFWFEAKQINAPCMLHCKTQSLIITWSQDFELKIVGFFIWKKMGKIIQTIFGKLDDGKEVEQFTLTNKNGMSVEVIQFSKTIRFFCLWCYYQNWIFKGILSQTIHRMPLIFTVTQLWCCDSVDKSFWQRRKFFWCCFGIRQLGLVPRVR